MTDEKKDQGSEEKLTFTATVSATPEQIGAGVFDALTAAAWADYRSMLRIEMVQQGVEDSQHVDPDLRLQFAGEAFRMVIGRLAPDSPFRAVLQRYAEETVPAVIRRGAPAPRPVLRLVE
jgi:hypothetical protein